uniref:Uncharacterized protein n=1 Tax=Glossina palpalis gambiensis TaxID=67801 RepID=A0A1B0C525_9MUSC
MFLNIFINKFYLASSFIFLFALRAALALGSAGALDGLDVGLVTAIEELVTFAFAIKVNGSLVGGALADSRRLIKAGGNIVGGIGGGGGAAIKATLPASVTEGKGDLSASSSSSSSLHCDKRRRSVNGIKYGLIWNISAEKYLGI